jgi:hypothetical protein
MRDLNRRRKSAYGPEPNGIATTNTLAHGCKADFAVSSICPDNESAISLLILWVSHGVLRQRA